MDWFGVMDLDMQVNAVPGATLQLQPTTMVAPRRAGRVIPELEDQVDLKAPGVRDQLHGASMPFQSLTQRGSLYDPNPPVAAPLQWGDLRPGFLSAPENIKFHEELHRLTRDNNVVDHWTTVDVGTFSVPYTGFSRLRDITPHGSHKFI
jgi:hypothetical protein